MDWAPGGGQFANHSRAFITTANQLRTSPDSSRVSLPGWTLLFLILGFAGALQAACAGILRQTLRQSFAIWDCIPHLR